jgi:hypothetical protein
MWIILHVYWELGQYEPVGNSLGWQCSGILMMRLASAQCHAQHWYDTPDLVFINLLLYCVSGSSENCIDSSKGSSQIHHGSGN